MGLADDETLPHQMDSDEWPALKERFKEIFRSKTRAEWTAIFDGTDACVAPVLEMDEVMSHSHNAARKFLIPREDNPEFMEAAAAPRLSRTPGVDDVAPRMPEHGEHTLDVLREFGFSTAEVEALAAEGAVAVPGAEGGAGGRSRL